MTSTSETKASKPAKKLTSLFFVFPTGLLSSVRMSKQHENSIPAGTESNLQQQSTAHSSGVNVRNSAMNSNQPNSFWKVLFPNSNCWHSWFVLKTAIHGIWGVSNKEIFKSSLHCHLSVSVPLTNSNIYPKELSSNTSTVLKIIFLQ